MEKVIVDDILIREEFSNIFPDNLLGLPSERD